MFEDKHTEFKSEFSDEIKKAVVAFAKWNCQHPFSQKTPKILTAVDQAARTESMLLSR